jgi:ABC-type Na+ efflux pump permease subunit
MPSDPHDDPEPRKFLEFTSRDNGSRPIVAETNRNREAKYRSGATAVILVLLALGAKLFVLNAKITREPRTVKLDNLTPGQMEALLRIHGIDVEQSPSTTNEQTKTEEQMERVILTSEKLEALLRIHENNNEPSPTMENGDTNAEDETED